MFKDIFPRYKTMCGYYVERKGGWDCHGLPVELAVEAKLGFTRKEDIERYGIAEFNERCRESVLSYVAEWNRLTERIAFWIDLDDAYRTMDPGYVESVWWALKTIHERGLLYEKLKVVPYCPRDQTTLSSHELGQPGVYRDVVDPSAYVRLPVRSDQGPVRAGDQLVVWTTTPWTLVSNAAVAVNPVLPYVRARGRDEDTVFVVAEELVEDVLGEDAEILETFPGAELEGVAYEPPFPFIPAEVYGELGHTVLPADFVTADDGTGLVHTAIAFGEDDFQLGERFGLNVINPVRLDGTFDDRIGKYAGIRVKDADPDLIEDLRARGKLLRAEPYEHSYPHCWRCGTPLLYYAKPSWYIATSEIKDRLLASNETVTWYPEHVKHGRFGKWLEGNVDWALSRERYWGTPLPVWRCDDEHVRVVGSLDELRELSGVTLDRSAPAVRRRRRVRLPRLREADAPRARGDRRVVRLGLDAVRAVPFTAPERGALPRALPGRLHLRGARPDPRLVLLAARGLDAAVRPLLVPQRRLPGADPRRAGPEDVQVARQHDRAVGRDRPLRRRRVPVVLLHLEAALGRLPVLARDDRRGGQAVPAAAVEHVRVLRPVRERERDRAGWRRCSRAEPTSTDGCSPGSTRPPRSSASGSTTSMSTTAGRAIQEYVEELSNWYIRRSRRRFWDGDPAAFQTLRECLVTVSKLLAPFCPFLADEIYDNLDGAEPSVHLCGFPEPGSRDAELEDAMQVVRETVALGLAARSQASLKLRQPLRAAVVVATGDERAAIERFAELVRDELNVRELRFVSEADELGELEVKPNYRTLGPRFGKEMPLVAAAVAGLDPAHVSAALRDGRAIGISVAGHDHQLAPEDLLVSMKPLAGYQVEREGSHAVALELELDEELRREGLARDIVRAVQLARQQAGLEVTDRIALTLDGDGTLIDAARTHEDYIAGETLATSVSYESLDGAGTAGEAGGPVQIDGRDLRIGVAVA